MLNELSGSILRARVYALHEAGWTLADIAAAFKPPKSRSTIHTWTRTPPKPGSEFTISLPPPPLPPLPPHRSLAAAEKSTSKPPRRERRIYDDAHPRIAPDLYRKIQELAPLARRYRARANPTGAYALANEELTVLCRRLHASGVSVRELALAADVTYRAMARRIGR